MSVVRQTASIFLALLIWCHFGWSQEAISYVVQPKDSLYSVSRRFGVTIQALERINNISDPRKIKVGQRLIIPNLSSPANNQLSHPVQPVPSPFSPKVAAAVSSTVPVVSSASAEAAAVPQKEDPSPTRRYVFLDKVKDIIDAPHVIPGRWRYIVLHHSATPEGSARAFDIAHRNRGMVNGLAYHFVIGNGSFTGDGEIEVGGRWLKQIKGGHLKFDSLNEIAIGICFVGNFDETRPTRKQIAAAIELISYLREICGPVPPVLMTHTEIHPHHTECPGKLFPTEAFHTLFPGDADQAELARLRSVPN